MPAEPSRKRLIMYSAKQFTSGLSVNLRKGANGKNLAPARGSNCLGGTIHPDKKALDLRLANTVPLWAENSLFLYHQPTVNKVE